MAGHKYIKPDIIDLEFWTKMPLKLAAVKCYDKSLVILIFLFYKKILLLNKLFFFVFLFIFRTSLSRKTFVQWYCPGSIRPKSNRHLESMRQESSATMLEWEMCFNV